MPVAYICILCLLGLCLVPFAHSNIKQWKLAKEPIILETKN